MIAATRGLVVGTVLLAVATAGLVYYTRDSGSSGPRRRRRR